MPAPDWMTEGASPVRRAQIERDYAMSSRRAPPTPEEWGDAEHIRRMRDHRKWADANRAQIDAEWEALEGIPLTIKDHIAHARKLREQFDG